MKIKDITTLVTKSVSPLSETTYHLYSLPSFDEGKHFELVKGNQIQSSKYLVPDKCILFNKLNVRFKRVWRINNLDNNKLCSTEFLPLVIDESKVDYEYCYYLLISDSITSYLCGQNSNTSGSHKRIEPNNFINIDITLPDLSTQRRIGKLLSDIDKKIALNRAINDNLEAMARQLYDYWFVQFDFPDENGKPYKTNGGKLSYNSYLKQNIPDGWNLHPLYDLLNLEDSKRIPLSNKEREVKKGIYPYYGATGIMDYVNDFLFDEDLLLLAEDGSTSDENGNPVVQYIWGMNWVNNHAHIIKSKEKGQLYYYYFVLKQIPVVLIETGSIQKKISQQNLLAYKTIVPSADVIENFSKIVNPLQELRKKNFDEIVQLTKQRDELLPLLMNCQVSAN